MNLLIVESPGKVQKIQCFLGDGWKVMASKGHVRDLPKNELGVSADYQATYEPTAQGRKALADIAYALKKVDAVYLATDPDREGEGIAWHLKDALKLANPFRVTYTEITESAVKKALESPRKIDMNLVKAQEARRVLDRLVGYPITKALKDAAKDGSLSAGRVQTPSLRLVVEREAAIQDFKSTTHFGVELTFEAMDHAIDGWKAAWNPKNWLEEDQEYFLDKAAAERLAGLKSLTVATYEESESRQPPPAPFTTSTLQQAASNALKFNPGRTMDLAQELYQQGHITYMRTDSPNISDEAITDIRSLASKNDWPVPPKPRTWKSKDGAQEAHEAIRPTHFELDEAGANDDEKALYRLIRLRALACQLDDAVFAVAKASLETDVDGKKVTFEARGRHMLTPGWRVLMSNDQAEDQDGEAETDNEIPKLRPGSQVVVVSGEVKTKKTSPPARYTQASLIRDLEKRGIGRPSTYANIMDKITERQYFVENKKRQLEPTPTGQKLIAYLVGKFAFADYDFTKKLEDRLDDIAAGRSDYLTVVSGAASLLDMELSGFLKTHGLACPDCGKALRHVFKVGKFDFWSCTAYPACEASFDNDNGRPGKRQEPKKNYPLTDHKCLKCKRPLSHISGTDKNGRAYDFYACSGRPKCKQTFSAKDLGISEG